ncbi:MAG: UDP-N-acetylmuramoyl-L-alanine--D-glutamate ligase [Candidatus Falkowbacteria bacterium]|nr:UDP-N-acetylmuramoyl-L-alanine--D-glutamate ligase [Candidatus Falkowbacteria bacterium]
MNKKIILQLDNKKIAFLGLGIENLALIKFLLKKKTVGQITVCDFKTKEALGKSYLALAKYKKINWKLGDNANRGLDSFDVLFRSPGWPLFDKGLVETKKMKVEVTSAGELFFKLCPSKNIIGVTGSKGKGTTASLIFHILRQAKKRVWLAGNIGVAPFALLEKIKKNDWVVLELSSFQLEDLKYSPRVAVITNFSPEHLSSADPHNPNYHYSLRDYWRAKLAIARWQKSQDWLVVNKNLKKKIKNLKLKSKIRFFQKSDLPSKLIGEHNQQNIAAAVAVAKILGIAEKIYQRAIASFAGLEHRLELVGKTKNIAFYNDSLATTPEAAITALKAFARPIILLAGGADKGANFKELAREIKKRVKFLVLLHGAATPRLKREVVKAKFPSNKIKLVKNMPAAVRIAKREAKDNDIILLSPACASFGMFKNYKERGRLFKKEVKKQFRFLR